MKEIIKGVTYNTDTAEHIADVSNELGRGDFRYLKANLYRTKRGAYFLAGEGGALTSFAVRVENNANAWRGSKGIVPLTEDTAAYMRKINHPCANV